MKLINADALLDGYKHMGYDPTDYPEDSYMEGWCKGFNAAVDHCMHHVIHAPTITPERKRGRWMKAGTYHGEQIWQCSECHADFEIPTITDFSTFEAEPIWVHCPNCGADMREGADG